MPTLQENIDNLDRLLGLESRHPGLQRMRIKWLRDQLVTAWTKIEGQYEEMRTIARNVGARIDPYLSEEVKAAIAKDFGV